MINYLYIFISLSFFFTFLVFYVRPLRRDYFNMKNRAAIFSRSSESLRIEKKALLENLNEGIITADASSRITYLNWQAQVFFKLDSDENILGKTFSEITQFNSSPIWATANRIINEALTSKERSHTILTDSKNEQIHLNLIAIPTSTGNGIILIIQDRSNQQKILDMGKDFIANASHELRTPITIIRGFAEMLKDLEEISEVMHESILEKIIRNCERMENLVKNLLTIADLDNSTSPKMMEADLVSIIESSCNQILNLHPNTHIEQFHNQEVVPIWGNPDLLELALINLLKNAIKYSPHPATIKITIDAQKDEVEVAISDQGLGIPQKDLDKVFHRFYTVDKAHSRKLGGAGLGLSIVKIIVTKHNGKIWATRNPDQGSTFHLSFLINQL